jgi:hypothetical protein
MMRFIAPYQIHSDVRNLTVIPLSAAYSRMRDLIFSGTSLLVVMVSSILIRWTSIPSFSNSVLYIREQAHVRLVVEKFEQVLPSFFVSPSLITQATDIHRMGRFPAHAVLFVTFVDLCVM